jgi:hypothetical protein
MSEIIFSDKNKQPDDDLLKQKLGEVYPYWLEIKKIAEEICGDTSEEWKFYGKNYGWQLKTYFKKRNLFFLIPYQGKFKIVFIFGDKAVKEIEKSNISNDIKKDLRNAKKYMEGRGIAINVESPQYLLDIKRLMDIKIK